MEYDVMTIRGKDADPRYKVFGTDALDVRVCPHVETLPGKVCPVCGLRKPDLNEANKKA